MPRRRRLSVDQLIDDAADKMVDDEINELRKKMGLPPIFRTKKIHTKQARKVSKSRKKNNHNIKLKKDGSVDKRCTADKNQTLRLKKDGNMDKRCKVYKEMQKVTPVINRNIISEEDALERALMISVQNASALEHALRISAKQAIPTSTNHNNHINDNNDNRPRNNKQQNVVISLVEKRTYFCRICVPNKKYKSKKHYDKHMAQHNNNSRPSIMGKRKHFDPPNTNTPRSCPPRIKYKKCERESSLLTATKNNNNTNNNNIGPSIMGKRRHFDPPNTNTSRPRKKHKKCEIESSITVTKIKCDLDMVKLQRNSYLNNKNGGCYIKYNGEPYRLKLYINKLTAHLQMAKANGVYCEYEELGNVDYIIVIAQDNNRNKSNIYLSDFAVLLDSNGIKRLKLTPIVRKYYIMEREQRMAHCKGYMVRYTQSRQETMNKICDYYYKLLYFFNHRNAGKELILTKRGMPYSFQEFQETERNIIILD